MFQVLWITQRRYTIEEAKGKERVCKWSKPIRGGQSGMKAFGKDGCVHSVAVSFAPINTLVFIILLALNSCLAFLSQIALTLLNCLHYAVLSVYMYTALHTRLLIFTIPCSGYRWDSWRWEITSPEFMQLVTGLARGGTRGGTQTFCLQTLCSSCWLQLIPRPQSFFFIPKLDSPETSEQ